MDQGNIFHIVKVVREEEWYLWSAKHCGILWETTYIFSLSENILIFTLAIPVLGFSKPKAFISPLTRYKAFASSLKEMLSERAFVKGFYHGRLSHVEKWTTFTLLSQSGQHYTLWLREKMLVLQQSFQLETCSMWASYMHVHMHLISVEHTSGKLNVPISKVCPKVINLWQETHYYLQES